MRGATRPEAERNGLRFLGLFLIACGIFLILSLYSADVRLELRSSAVECKTGLAGAYAAFYSAYSVGETPAKVLAILVALWGISVLGKKRFFGGWRQILGGALVVGSLSLFFTLLATGETDPLTGGLVGVRLEPLGRELLGSLGVAGATGLLFLLGAHLVLGPALATFFRAAYAFLRKGAAIALATLRWLARLGGRCAGVVSDRISRRRALSAMQAAAVAPASSAEGAVEGEAAEGPSSEIIQTRLPLVTRREKRTRALPKSKKDGRILGRAGSYVLPPMSLLEESDSEGGEHRGTTEKRAEILEKTLADFKIDGKVVGVECGPRVTMFEVALAPGIRVERIFSLANNITMALKAYNVRIVAPIPGKDTVGIEIPNMDDRMVYMRDVLPHYDLKKNPYELPIFLGMDLAGGPIISNLEDMPHLLIAGATGSGKSVCLNAILLSFLMTRRPDELKLILVDPKMVELSRFRDVPHLLCPVVTDMKRASGILEWACAKMDERYECLSLMRVNNIGKFNALGEEEIGRRLAGILSEEEAELFPKRIPYLVIVMDELADLMLVAGKDVEKSIIRLASKSRAVGIHVILATQRPSVDVITGLIKANMPSRIAFQVASKVDSRTILDGNGAESLLGAGDMLYVAPRSSKLIRAQGIFVDDAEIAAVVRHCRAQCEPEYHEELEGEAILAGEAPDNAERDPLFDGAVRAVLENRRGSVSLLQRKFGVGYGRASRIIDRMAEAGILGPFREGKARAILMTLEEYEARFRGEGEGEDGTFETYEDSEEGDAAKTLAGLRKDERPPLESAAWEV
ncbi:MAG: DNA translocase FtsK 4TM domain-containing protein [Planctomycetota bacterium]